MFRFSTRITIIMAVGLIYCHNAQAYLDPGSLNIATQILAALCTWFVLGFMFFRSFFIKVAHKIRHLLKIH